MYPTAGDPSLKQYQALEFGGRLLVDSLAIILLKVNVLVANLIHQKAIITLQIINAEIDYINQLTTTPSL